MSDLVPSSRGAVAGRESLDTPLDFDGPFPHRTAGGLVAVGALPQNDGGIRFRLPVRGARTVVVTPQKGAPIELLKEADGLFTGELPFDPGFTGPRNLAVEVNGATVLLPELPIVWSDNGPTNAIDVPELDRGYLALRNVPHGAVVQELVFSEAAGDWRRILVWTPPGYARGGESLPVLYLLHGYSDNELAWSHQGRLGTILDNLLADGEIEPFLVVMVNAMDGHRETAPLLISGTVERVLLDDVVPFVESRHRVRADKWSRAIAGLSLGAYLSNDIGLANPDRFGFVGQFTASMTQETMRMSYERPWRRVLEDPAGRDPERFARDYRLFFRSTTRSEDHFEYFEADDAIYAAAGVDQLPCYRRIVHPDGTSKWTSWRLGLRDFARLVFREP